MEHLKARRVVWMTHSEGPKSSEAVTPHQRRSDKQMQPVDQVGL